MIYENNNMTRERGAGREGGESHDVCVHVYTVHVCVYVCGGGARMGGGWGGR